MNHLARKTYLPDFVIIGAAKSGTTFLSHSLAHHPDLFQCQIKEPCFFSNDEIYEKGQTWYEALYKGASPSQLLFEASTNYTFYPHYTQTVSRLKQSVPHAKLIYVMRHPVERTYSHFIHRHLKELYPGYPFLQSLTDHIDKDPLIINASLYQKQLEIFFQSFDPKNFMFVIYEDLIANPTNVLKSVCTFLGINSSFYDTFTFESKNTTKIYLDHVIRENITEGLKQNNFINRLITLLPKPINELGYQLIRRLPKGRKINRDFLPPPLNTSTRQLLLQRFNKSNQWVASLLNQDLDHWNQ